MDRNSIVAILVVFGIWMFWTSTQEPSKKPENLSSPEKTAQVAKDSKGKTLSQPSQRTDSINSQGETPKKATALINQVPEVKRVLENELLRITLSSTKAQVEGIVLKRFNENIKEGSPPVQLVTPQADQYPFGIMLDSSGDEIVSGFREIDFNQEKNEVTYRYEEPGHLRIDRTYQLSPGSYDLKSDISLTNLSAKTIREQPGISWGVWVDKEVKKGFMAPPPDLWLSMALLAGNQLEKNKVKPGEEAEPLTGSISWASLGNRYFLMALFPLWEGGSKLKVKNFPYENGNVLQNSLWASQLKIDANETKILSFRVFSGPKELSLLDAQGSNLNRTLDLGIFEFFALLLLKVMQFFHKFLPNWGLAIIALTVLVKGVFFPLSHKSFKSMREMQKIQPLMKELKEKYKDDKEQLNAQTLKLMREHKVNPLGGCLPMLIQMPIWFALYKVLYSSIELRHAPFYLWIDDLSAKDPYYITPMLMGAAMFLQQKFTPKPPDPTQAKMMMLMPIMFTGFMVFLPSGLVIYIFCNTFLSILQQWYINRSFDGKPILPKLATNRR